MAREDLHFRLRIPETLKKQVEEAAAENHRSMTAEIVARLEASFAQDSSAPDPQFGSWELPDGISSDDLAVALEEANRQAVSSALQRLGILRGALKRRKKIDEGDK